MRVRLGKVMLTPRGAYNNSTSYDFLDVVYKDASSYVSLSYENTGHNVTDTNYWQPLVDGAYIETYFDSRFIKRLSLTVPQGMSVTGSPVTAPEGTLAITLDNGYALLDSLTSSKINVAYNMRHTHTNLDLLNQITAARMAHWDAGGGGGGGGTTTEYDARYVKIEWFTQLFKAMDSSNSEIFVNNPLTGFASIKATKNFWSQGGVSALGTGSSGGGGGGGEGVPLNTLLDDLNNSTLGGSSPAGNEGKVLGYTSNGWAFVTPSSGGSSTLEGLTDTIISSPASGQVLTYNGQNWVNSAAPSSTDLAAVWASLTKSTADQYAATAIHADHIPDLSGTYLPKAGGTVTGRLTVNEFISTPYINLTDSSQQIYSGNKIWNLPSASGTLATEAQLENYVSKDFFNRLFRAFNGTTPVTPNDTTTVIDNIKAMADFWSAGAVAALGTSSGSGGGGQGVKLNSPLYEINQQLDNTNPSDGGSIIVYDGGIWGYRTLASITSGYVPTTRTVTAVNGLIGGGALSSDISIALSPTTLADIADGVEANGWGNHAEAGYADDDAVLHLDNRTENVYGEKTFAVYQNMRGIHLNPAGDIDIQTTDNGQYHIGYNAGNQNGGFNIMNIKGSTYTPLITGLDNGNVGIGNYTPAYKLDVAGEAYASGRIWSGLSIGAKTTDTEGFRFEWDSNNNAVFVVKADGTPCNFYSLGGVSALGVGAAGATPSISAMNITSLTATTFNATTIKPASGQSVMVLPAAGQSRVKLRISDGDYEGAIGIYNGNLEIEADNNIYLEQDTILDEMNLSGMDGGVTNWSISSVGSANFKKLKVGSLGSVINSIKWNTSTNRLDVVIGSNTYSFQPVSS